MSTKPLPTSYTFTLSSALSTLRSRWKTIGVSVVLFAFLGVVFVSLLPGTGIPVWRRPYDFTATLSIQLARLPAAARSAAGFDPLLRAMELFEDPENFARALDSDLEGEELRETMTNQYVAERDRRAYRITIDFFHNDPEFAARTVSRLNDAVRRSLSEQIDSRLRAVDAELADSIAANDAIPWPADSEPSVAPTPEPRLARSTPIGVGIFIAAGLIVGVLLAFLYEPLLRAAATARRRLNSWRAGRTV